MAEHNLVLALIPNNRDSCWIGLNDIQNEGVFEWTDGSASNFRFFEAMPPDNSTGDTQDCVQIKTGPGGRWDDDSCTRNRVCFVCGVEGECIQYNTNK